ncbi:MAG: DUF2225 domain-containing protein [Leptospira sp.]|nr:DUF2225 domain-containing protein [Leptospira sp.]
MLASSQQSKKASFRAKENSVCPVCDEIHQKENMFQGGGRLIAGKLTQDLRRLYEKNKKFGRINPNDYVISVCPKCLYATLQKDWSSISAPEIAKLKNSAPQRREFLEKILGPLDFKEDRNIVLGAGSYLLAVDCYQNRAPTCAPTPKKAVCAIRAAWYFDDLNTEYPGMSFDKVRDILYQRAATWYGITLEIMQSGSEPIDSAAGMLGPDTDNNWGFDGVVYLNAYLTMKFKDQMGDTPEKKLDLLVRAKRMLARLYGSGKSSKSKPSVIIDMSKELYEEYGKVIEEMGGEK